MAQGDILSVDDHGLEVLKKAGVDIGATPKRDYAIQTVIKDTTEFAVRIDEVGATTYVGKAVVGSSDSSAVWQIKRIVETGPDMAVTFADGDSSFNNIWNDRLSLSYS